MTAEDVKKIRENAKVDVARAQEIEQETRHDVVAFTRQVHNGPTCALHLMFQKLVL
jgi:adenylosuccinate lyase